MIVQRHGWLLASFVLAAYFALTVSCNGIPALRHDWFWPRAWTGADDVFLAAAQGWQTQGLGGPNPFVNNYLLVAFLVPLEALFGAYGALVLFLFAAAFAIALCARKLAIAFGANDALAIVAAGFALFNPWTYTQVVAGHGAMLVAYAATMALIAEAVGPAPRAAVCASATAFTLPQLQFFLPSLVVVVALVVLRRQWLPLATWGVAGAANMLGIALAAHSLARIPVTTAWEQTQSLAPFKALLLSGYFARYADGYDHVGAYAVACVAVLALVGCAWGVRRRPVAVACVATALVLVAAMGIRGPLAFALPALIERVPAMGLYRELYDLVGYATIGYLILSVVAASRHALLTAAFACAALVLLVLWQWHTPTRFWVDRRTLPELSVVASPDTRIGLLPPFQPLSYRGRYSGLDPDAYPRAHDIAVINDAVPSWPGDAALAMYAKDGDWRPLAALSVSEIADRPWYSMTPRELGEQLALPLTSPFIRPRVAPVVSIPAVPLLSLIRMPPAVSVSDRIGAGAVFFGDVAGIRAAPAPSAWATFVRPRLVQPSKRYVHASDGWVDARLAFPTDPEVAQPFGGALTVSQTELLGLPGTGMLLVYVRGELQTRDGRRLTGSTKRLQWISLPTGVDAVRCRGLCEVVMQGSVPAGIPENAQPPSAQAVALAALTPWLVTATLPPGPAAALRYNVRFDEHWECWSCPSKTLHLPIDATVNGWLLPMRSAPVAVRLVERVALLQTVAQCVGLAWILVVLSLAVRDARNREP